MANKHKIQTLNINAKTAEDLSKEVNYKLNSELYDNIELVDIKFFTSQDKFHAMIILKNK